MLNQSDATPTSPRGRAASEPSSWRTFNELASSGSHRQSELRTDQASSTSGRLLLTPAEAAERLSISRTKIYELMAAGSLRSIHIGRLRRVPVEALRDFVGALESR